MMSGFGWPGSGGGGRTLIEELIISEDSDPSLLDFNNLPQSYNKLVIEGFCRSNRTGNITESLGVYINEDTTDSNYHREISYIRDGSHTGTKGNTPLALVIPSDDIAADNYAFIQIEIPGYSVPNKEKILYQTAASIITMSIAAVHWSSVDAISRIRFAMGSDIKAGSIARIYGLK